MPHRTGANHRSWRERALSLLLAAVLLLGAVPGLSLPASAHWADQYLEQLVDWGVMRADQTTNPDAPITRADFMAIINRAYGYTKTGPIPFVDVQRSDWFYDDVAIAYNAGYMAGTSPVKASPNLTLNREMAVCILARNMMLQETPGENLAFSDARSISSWARGLVKTAVDNYIVSGYPNGKFGPQDYISKGQMATLIVQCIGTPLNQAGDYSLGDVFGNVTVTTSGVTLRDTTISGDLYVSGGVGLGDVKLENVNVLGRIIVSGTGESQEGDASVVLRNVTANSMLVDNMKDQLVTLRAEGLTNISQVTVRTNAYLEDNAPDDYGLRKITMEETGGSLDLAGRIKEVVNVAPRSNIQLAKGTLAKLTVDEDATNSSVQIDRNTEIGELNLDTGTSVTGQGDVDKMNINASGVTSTMLPDDIYIRPGLEANVAGTTMDSAAAEESSLDPRILSGYPQASDVAPTSLKAEFAANKKGTIYWAVSNITDGSITADNLITPPSYGSQALKSGSVATPSANTVVPVSITGLTVGGSYYLSAVLVDDRGERSPVKVISFTTPDNTKPAFAQGYPYLSLITDTMAQATVMATKSCKLYYAVLPQGAAAPTVNDLKSAAVTGNLGYGVVDVIKNTEHTFTISRQLEELKNYVAYFWLTDADGANSSNIVSLRFTTVDKTPPIFVVDPYVNQIAATSVRLPATLNENGTVYWAVVEHGTAYPKPQPGSGETTAPLDSDYAKLQVYSGMNCLRSGSVSVKANTEFTLNITGLAAEKTYDLYYLAKDTAGNYSLEVKMLEIHTLDNSGPVVKQSFTDYTGLDNTQNPLPSTDIVLEFSEDIASTAAGSFSGLSFLALATGNQPADVVIWPDDPAKALAEAMRESIFLYQIKDGRESKVTERNETNETESDLSWTIDYRNATVTAGEGGKILVTFPTNSADPSQSALNLASGATYFFRFENIIDTSQGQNRINPHPLWYGVTGAELHQVPAFTTVFAQVNLTSPGVGTDGPFQRDSNGAETGTPDYVDLSFRMDPDATAKVQDDNFYDVLLYSDTVTQYNLYYRILDAESKKPITDPDELSALDQNAEGVAGEGILLPAKNKTPDKYGWFYLGNSSDVNPAPDWSGRSVNGYFNGCNAANFPRVNQLSEEYTYEFVISLTRYGTSSVRETWNGQINFEVHVVAGVSNPLYRLSINPSKDALAEFLEDGLENGGGVTIGINRTQNYLPLRGSFIDSQLPKFNAGYPQFLPGDSFATMQFNLTRDGTIYYVVAEKGKLDPILKDTVADVWEAIPESGEGLYLNNGDLNPDVYREVTSPVSGDIFNPRPYQSSAYCGSVPYAGGALTLDEVLSSATKKTLKPTQDYYVYIVLKGVSDELSPVYTFKFTTTEVSAPKILLDNAGDGLVYVHTEEAPGDLDYVIYSAGDITTASSLQALRDKPKTSDLVKPLDGDYKDFSVLQMLLTEYNNPNDSTDKWNGYSVFDVYAGSTLKSTVARLIQQASSGLATGQGTGVMTEEDAQPKFLYSPAPDKMEPITPYYVLVVGKHPSSTDSADNYTFKAIGDIQIPDQDPPELSNASCTISLTPGATNKFSGGISLTFDKQLYWVSSSTSTEKPKEIHQNCTTHTGTGGTAVDAKDLALSLGTVKDHANGPDRLTNTLQFTYENLESGGTITFTTDGVLTNSSGVRSSKWVTCIIRNAQLPSQSNIGLVGYYMEIYWGYGQIGSNTQKLMFTSELIQP